MLVESAVTGQALGHDIAVGQSVPPHTAHAISVSLPTWSDNVGYEEGEKRVVDAMVNGYPRFFIHLSIRKLEKMCEKKYAAEGERSMLFPTQRLGDDCRSFIERRSQQLDAPVAARLVHMLVSPGSSSTNGHVSNSPPKDAPKRDIDLHIVLFPESAYPVAKEFWQHTGTGISSRLAEYCLSILPDEGVNPSPPTTPDVVRFFGKSTNRHYATKGVGKLPSPTRPQFPPIGPQKQPQHDDFDADLSVYVEERYGRNLPLAAAASAKRAMRRRISGVLIRDNVADCHGVPCAGIQDVELGPSTRGVSGVSEDDVFLYPSGMSAIWSAHQIALATLPPAKSVCFGFPYTDTLKILQKWGPGCHFLGHGLDSDIDTLERILEQESQLSPNTPPILALFTEFPSNPLLRSANLPRLRALADKYDFLIVIDETIGNFVNVEVLPYADILVSSLSKIFSGVANVMGGNLTLNPRGRHYEKLKAHLAATFEDFYFDEDAIFMERNSRDFKPRIRLIDTNTEAVCDLLRAHSAAVNAPSAVIKEVFYPKYITAEHYEHCRIKTAEDSGGYGGLFSLTFTSPVASKAFFDNLSCYKGPSLGTNFTLACPFTILAHYMELDWAAQFGVEKGLVRVSVGMEDATTLLQTFRIALEAAEAAVRATN